MNDCAFVGCSAFDGADVDDGVVDSWEADTALVVLEGGAVDISGGAVAAVINGETADRQGMAQGGAAVIGQRVEDAAEGKKAAASVADDVPKISIDQSAR